MVEPKEVVAETASEDPEVGLRAVASLRALLEAVEELQVRQARELGWSRSQIAAQVEHSSNELQNFRGVNAGLQIATRDAISPEDAAAHTHLLTPHAP